MSRKKSEKSKLEGEFLRLWRILGEGYPDPVPEFRFHPTRKWRFDFAFPEHGIAVELEGGTFSQGRHTSGIGHHLDCDKYNQAAALDWSVFRFTVKHLTESPVQSIELIREQIRKVEE